jgi:hypothetical protein
MPWDPMNAILAGRGQASRRVAAEPLDAAELLDAGGRARADRSVEADLRAERVMRTG